MLIYPVSSLGVQIIFDRLNKQKLLFRNYRYWYITDDLLNSFPFSFHIFRGFCKRLLFLPIVQQHNDLVSIYLRDTSTISEDLHWNFVSAFSPARSVRFKIVTKELIDSVWKSCICLWYSNWTWRNFVIVAHKGCNSNFTNGLQIGVVWHYSTLDSYLNEHAKIVTFCVCYICWHMIFNLSPTCSVASRLFNAMFSEWLGEYRVTIQGTLSAWLDVIWQYMFEEHTFIPLTV